MYSKCLISVMSLSLALAVQAADEGVHPGAALVSDVKQHKDNPTQTPVGTPVGLVVDAAVLLIVPTEISQQEAANQSARVGMTSGTPKQDIKQQAEMWHEPPPLPPLPPYPSATDTQEVEPVTGTTLFNGENMVYVPLGQTLRFKAQTQHE